MSDLILSEQDRNSENHLTDEGRQKVKDFLDVYSATSPSIVIKQVSERLGVSWVAAKRYVTEYLEEVRVGLVNKDGTLVLVQKRLYDVLRDIQDNPARYKFKDEMERIRFETELIDKILAYKKLENPINSLEDLKDANVLLQSLGERLGDYLNKKINGDRKMVEQKDANEPTTDWKR